jgi:hypothetical protein
MQEAWGMHEMFYTRGVVDGQARQDGGVMGKDDARRRR